ncbi:hypothetical protein ThrDRAFT_03176 [Frankia casuarinae]|jgi:hypothetical protein|uniref:Integral membrane protein n=2 Tax=Frankia casuarinae (strain DSM 45818 / CECT 9043 / HFP020203 / CcI3) TaxID=106370 RepID=Q2J8B2_FRACC|nr:MULTISPECIES: DUF3043 domain-containing protein [Frankia]ABD12480.1 putative integral membrane protein [Frankia casuarinae]ETA00067.1 hypothetical protein CcI6DRAFT_04525 [Frankia sp. CcI6]EYT91157.1 hypothetical protein ThrDRAFT_03176 [Frankia casuarinae]KDA42340.1 hypothetical protein BMG523Draft_02857 [Frankia sp. BMG5.23]KEZ36380.1 Protein of unknown function (DUF3043) [Frankia sp. CeD]
MALLKRRNSAGPDAGPGPGDPIAEQVERVEQEKVADPRRTAAKGRPTPRRAEARAARTKPGGALGVSANKQEARAARRRQSQEYRAAMMSGDVSRLPARERAPERVLTRDFVDTRINVGSFFLPIAVVYFVGGLVPNASIRLAATLLMLLGIVAVVIDSILLSWQVSRRVAEKYPDSRVRVRAYAAQRALLPRRWRLPRPRVSRSDPRP